MPPRKRSVLNPPSAAKLSGTPLGWQGAIDASADVPVAQVVPPLPRCPLDHLEDAEKRIVAAGRDPITDWWRETLRAFYAGGKTQLVLRVGRRGQKSASLCLALVLDALYGDHPVAPGDVGVVAIVSVTIPEAKEKLELIDKLLTWLDVPHKSLAREIQLTDRAIEFRVFAATMAGVSGFTCIGALCDEVSKWIDADTGANPATEVLASLRPTLAGVKNAKMFLASSPLGKLDAHAEAFDAGSTALQDVAYAPTWVARPALTREMCLALEPNESRFRREYEAIPMEGSEESLLSPELLDRCTRTSKEMYLAREHGCSYVAAMDPGFTRNPWTLAVACMRWVGDKLKRSIVGVWQWQGTPSKPNEPEAIMRTIAAIVRPYGVDVIESDQYERFGLASISERPEINLYVRSRQANAQERLAMWESMVTQMADEEIDLPPDPQLRADLLGVRQRLTPNGFTIQLQEIGDRHCDYAPSVALALSSRWHEEPKRRVDPSLPTNRMIEDEMVAILRQRAKAQEIDWAMGGAPDED